MEINKLFDKRTEDNGKLRIRCKSGVFSPNKPNEIGFNITYWGIDGIFEQLLLKPVIIDDNLALEIVKANEGIYFKGDSGYVSYNNINEMPKNMKSIFPKLGRCLFDITKNIYGAI